MIIKPMVRSNICLNSHPLGCEAVVKRQIEYVRENIGKREKGEGRRDCCSQSERDNSTPNFQTTTPVSCSRLPTPDSRLPKLALIIGCSTGYGLASRIAAGFGYEAATVGISYERPASKTKPGTPGFYNNLVFDREAKKAKLVSITLDGDAFSDEIKSQAIEAIHNAAKEANIPPKVDLIIYSLASPVRKDPKTGITHRSVIKPIGKGFSGNTVDMMNGLISTTNAEPATDAEISDTVKVMGGEDWELWIETLVKEDVLAENARTLAYTYIGPELSWAIYKNGTIGRAKEDLERAAKDINKKYYKTPAETTASKAASVKAWVSVNKALVTRASAVIPIIPLYISCLYKVMKEKNIHEGCIEQIVRLYKDRLYTEDAINDSEKVNTDSEGRIRIDDLEMRDDVQKDTLNRIKMINGENIYTLSDLAGVKQDFMEVHGFDVAGVDYNAEVEPLFTAKS